MVWYQYQLPMLRDLVSISAANASWSVINISFKCYVVWYQYRLQMLQGMVSTSASNATWFGINISFKCYVWYQNQHQMLRDLVSISISISASCKCYVKCYVVGINISYRGLVSSNATISGMRYCINIIKCYAVIKMLRGLVLISASNATWFGYQYQF